MKLDITHFLKASNTRFPNINLIHNFYFTQKDMIATALQSNSRDHVINPKIEVHLKPSIKTSPQSQPQPIEPKRATRVSTRSVAKMSAQPGALNGASPSPHLPTILCLHGGGTSSTIFNIQTIRLQRALSSKFNFIFLDAPFDAPPGPGVLPVFEGCGPFYRWASLGKDGLPPETKDLIKRTVNSGSHPNVVGVLGFSQGAKLAAGLLLEQQLRLKGLADGEFKADADFPSFKFGVFLNGTSPPLVSSSLTPEQKKEKIRIPGLHVVGIEDPWRDESRKLYTDSFDEDCSTLLEFQIGHRLPVAEKDTQRIADEIVKLFGETHSGVDTNGMRLAA